MGASWLAALNTDVNIDVTSGNVQKRLRIELDAGGNVSKTPTFKYKYSKNGGAYADITTSSNDIQVSDSTHFTDGDDCAVQLLGSDTFITNNNGAVDATDGSFTMGATFTTGQEIETELSFNLIAADLSNADVIDIRIYDNDNAISTYTQTPRITITKSGAGRIMSSLAYHGGLAGSGGIAGRGGGLAG